MSAALLMDERFVAVFPSLVRALAGDITGAAVLQSIHYRLQQVKGSRNERRIVLPLTEISDDLGISKDQAKRACVKLVDAGLVVVHGEQIRGARRTIGIDYDALDALAESGAKSHHSEPRRNRTTSGAKSHQKWGESAPPFLSIEKEENKNDAPTSSSVADDVAKGWWEAQSPKPLGGSRAFMALRSLCRGAVDAGHPSAHVRATLDRLGYIPSATIFDKELRAPRAETWQARKIREEREAKEAADRRAEEALRETAARLAENDDRDAYSCPPPPEFRERVAALRKRSA